MRIRLSLVLAVAVVVLTASPGAAHGAKVTETAEGFSLPDSTQVGGPIFDSEGSQTFKLSGRKVRDRQVTDVNVTLNVGSAAGFSSLSEFDVTLVAPKGENLLLPTPLGSLGMIDLTFDDQSNLRPCFPTSVSASNCNYSQNGIFTGSLRAVINPTFRGLNPKGTWRLLFEDTESAGQGPTTIGTSTLEVRTARKFEKE